MTVSDDLIDWFKGNARPLPWRTEPRDAYRTLVSEVMLQQTQVDRVAPRFEEFVDRWPDLRALAAASEDEVLAMWSGLGYYRRARLLHRLAREVLGSGREQLPETIAELKALPGVGDYTAAAVGSLAFGLEAPVMDGNVQRVAARVSAFEGETRTSRAQALLKAWVGGLFPGHHPGVVNEALMELGATVCTPSGPRCGLCPLARSCAAFQTGRPEAFPPPRRLRLVEEVRWVAACIVAPDGRWLLRKVEDGPILRGLWLPPFAELEAGADPRSRAEGLAPANLTVGIAEVCDPVRHHITHRRIEALPVLLPAETIPLSAAVWQWSRPGAVDGGTSTLLEKLHKVIKNNNKRKETQS